MSHEEKLDRPSGAPAGGDKPQRNPLAWGIVASIIWLLPPYDFRDFVEILLPVNALVFLALYFTRSRFAWHVLAAHTLLFLPLYVFFSFSWRLQRAMNPWSVWVLVALTVPVVALLFWARKRYPAYLEARKIRHADERA